MSLRIFINKKTALYTILTIVGGFLFSLPAFADTPTLTQTLFETSYNAIGTNNGSTGQSFTATQSGTLTAVKIPLYRYQNVSGVGANCSLLIDVPLGVNNGFGSASQQIQSTGAPTSLGDWMQFNWSSGPTLTAGTQYWLTLSCGNNTQYANVRWYGHNADVIPGSFGTSTNQGTTITTGGPIADLGLIVYVNNPVTQNSISFATTPTSLPQFYNWTTNAFITSASTSEAEAGWWRLIAWSNDPSLLAQNLGLIDSDGSVGIIDPFFGTIDVQHNTPAVTARNLIAGNTYYAQAILCKQRTSNFSNTTPPICPTVDIVTSSAIWTFTINSSTPVNSTGQIDNNGNFISFSNATSTTNSSNFTCNTADNFFATSLCNMMQVLFQPQQQTIQIFGNLYNQVSTKPPFAYVTIYSNQINNLQSATSTANPIQTSTFDFTPLMVDFAQNTGWYQDLLTAMSWICWIAFVFYLYKRFKYFSMHG